MSQVPQQGKEASVRDVQHSAAFQQGRDVAALKKALAAARTEGGAAVLARQAAEADRDVAAHALGDARALLARSETSLQAPRLQQTPPDAKVSANKLHIAACTCWQLSCSSCRSKIPHA